MQSHTALTPDSTLPPPPAYNVKRVGFLDQGRATPVHPVPDPGLTTDARRVPASSGWACFSRWFCCGPDHELESVEPLPNWWGIGVENRYSMVSGSAARLLFAGDELLILNQGLNALRLFHTKVESRARSADKSLQNLTLFKGALSNDAAGISRQTIDVLIGHADALGRALARLDTLAKKTDGGGLSPALQETPLWQPCSVSPERPVGGAGTAILTPMDRFRANLSLDIEALKVLKARIPD